MKFLYVPRLCHRMLNFNRIIYIVIYLMNLIITTTNIYKSTFIGMNYVQLIDFKLGILSSVWLSCFICPFQFRHPHLNQIMKQLLYDKCLSTDNFYIIDKPCCPRGLIYIEGCHSLSSIISDLQHHKGYITPTGPIRGEFSRYIGPGIGEAMKGPMNLRSAHSLSHRHFILIFFPFLGVFSTIFYFI